MKEFAFHRAIAKMDDLISEACRLARGVGSGLTGDEDLAPFILAVPEIGNARLSVLTVPFPRDPIKRERFFEKLFADEVTKCKATQIAFGHMVWVAKFSDEDLQRIKVGLPIPSASSRADRQEAAVVMCANVSGEIACLVANVHRMPDRSVRIDEFNRSDNFREGIIPEALCNAFTPKAQTKGPWWRFGL